MIGGLTGNWTLLGQLLEWEGIGAWDVVSSDGSVVPLNLESGRRVRLAPRDSTPVIPEPSSLLVATGLCLTVGLACGRRRR